MVQWIARLTSNQGDVGSSPAQGIKTNFFRTSVYWLNKNKNLPLMIYTSKKAYYNSVYYLFKTRSIAD